MQFLTRLASVAVALALIPALASAAAVLVPRQAACSNAAARIEWRDLTDGQRAEYIFAVSCLGERRSTIVPGTSRLDDFARVHAAVYDDSESLDIPPPPGP